VGDGFYVRQAVDNIAWIDLGDCGLVVDALEQPELEGEVFRAIASTLGEKPVRYLLNTHTHYDHVALNRAFQRRWGTEIVNQSTSRIGRDGRWFQGPRRKVQMLPMPGCHTDEDCVVWVPEDRALFVGDIFGWGLIPLSAGLNARTARLLVDTHQRLIAFDAAVVIPGHGPVCSTAELRRWVEYFRWLHEQVSRACQAGKSDSQIAREVAPPADMQTWWRFLLWKHEDSLGKVIQAVRGGWRQFR
jgi:glyoxylase-like metal-dependent hydrolase (beta-lactamase superfamily II)